MSTITEESSLFEIDQELDLLLDEIQAEVAVEGSEVVCPELLLRFQQFCEVHSEKVDRIGRFLTMMEWRARYCKAEAARFYERARSADNKAERTKNMVLYYLASRDLRKIEGREFTLRSQKNSQDSIRILDEARIPPKFFEVDAKIPGGVWQSALAHLPQDVATVLNGCVRQRKPSHEAIRQALSSHVDVPGAELRRGSHLRVV